LALPDVEELRERPFLAMRGLAASMLANESFPPPPPTLIGAVMCSEGWMLTSGPKGEVPAEEAQAVSKHRLIHAHPLRVETRQLNAMDLRGREYMVLRERGGEVTVDTFEPDDRAYRGDLTNCLRELIDAINACRRRSSPFPWRN
jgi:hypothetical protein